mgnify:CR=1 FL=1
MYIHFIVEDQFKYIVSSGPRAIIGLLRLRFARPDTTRAFAFLSVIVYSSLIGEVISHTLPLISSQGSDFRLEGTVHGKSQQA